MSACGSAHIELTSRPGGDRQRHLDRGPARPPFAGRGLLDLDGRARQPHPRDGRVISGRSASGSTLISPGEIDTRDPRLPGTEKIKSCHPADEAASARRTRSPRQIYFQHGYLELRHRLGTPHQRQAASLDCPSIFKRSGRRIARHYSRDWSSAIRFPGLAAAPPAGR